MKYLLPILLLFMMISCQEELKQEPEEIMFSGTIEQFVDKYGTPSDQISYRLSIENLDSCELKQIEAMEKMVFYLSTTGWGAFQVNDTHLGSFHAINYFNKIIQNKEYGILEYAGTDYPLDNLVRVSYLREPVDWTEFGDLIDILLELRNNFFEQID